MADLRGDGPRGAGQPALTPECRRSPLVSRLAAGAAIAVAAATLVVLVVLTAANLPYAAGVALTSALALSTSWMATTNRRRRGLTVPATVLLLAVAIAILVAQGPSAVGIAAVLVGLVLAGALGSLALRWEVRDALRSRWSSVPSTRHGVVFVNPRSGDGKAVRFALAEEARRRGLEVLLLQPGDDLRELAAAAVIRGADALGMAGGDGSQAVVAAVAAAHGLPFVCVPTGTRNHFALDLGIDRDNPVRALDAFGEARESTIDLGEVNGEVFVNNVSLGLYAEIIQSEAYRNAKRQTVARMLPDLIGPEAPPSAFDLTSPFGVVSDAQVILVSNNPYRLSSVSGFGSRPVLDGGELGVATLTLQRPSDVDGLVALEIAGHPERYPGWRQWSAASLEVRGPGTLHVGLDGEARTLSSPLHFACRPRSLRVRIARGEVGASPAFLWAPLTSSTLVGLWRVLWGRPSGMVPVTGAARGVS
jgi:diacylglycerol kinase family enzyme